MMNEILNCIKLIKMYAWEKSFAKAISGKCVTNFSSILRLHNTFRGLLLSKKIFLD